MKPKFKTYTVSITQKTRQFYEKDFKARSADHARALAEKDTAEGLDARWSYEGDDLSDEQVSDVREKEPT